MRLGYPQDLVLQIARGPISRVEDVVELHLEVGHDHLGEPNGRAGSDAGLPRLAGSGLGVGGLERDAVDALPIGGQGTCTNLFTGETAPGSFAFQCEDDGSGG